MGTAVLDETGPMPVGSGCRRLQISVICLGAILLSPVSSGLAIDESLGQYFDQLRQRGLYSIAESYAVARLSQDNLSKARRADFAIELSRTLVRHAESASANQQEELWNRARAVVDEERSRKPSAYGPLLAAQSAIVPADEAEWLRIECQLKPFDEEIANRARSRCAESIQRLMAIEQELLVPQKEKKEGADSPSSHTMRVALHQARFSLARSLRNRAELTPVDSRQRLTDLIDAETTLRKVLNAADEPIPFRAKLLLVDCDRLKGDLSRAEEKIAVLEKNVPNTGDPLLEEVAAERVRILLDRHQADAAVEIIVQVRSGKKRLTGELWFLQIRSLLALRDLATAKKNSSLADKLREEAEISLRRCDEQVGGFWSRRCHQLWDATRTADKYGPELDAIMQQARADFVAGRMELAVKGYARGEAAARAASQVDLAADLGYTRASILLQDKQFDSAATEFLRISSEYPQSPRAANAHLNAVYCLGRKYDELKTQANREKYTQALDDHLQRFAADPTADDVRYFKAQLEEQRLQATAALPLYLKIAPNHSRSAEAYAGAARCYETILVRMRERKMATDEFERTALATLQPLVPRQDAVQSAPQAEVALHLAAIQLMAEPPQFDRAEELLNRIVQTSKSIETNDPQQERWHKLRQRAESLRVVALAGGGKPLEAEKLIDSLASASPKDLLVIIDRLAPFVASPNRQRQIQYAALQLHAVEQIARHRSSLSRDVQDQLDESLARAYLASGQITKALEIYERQALAAPKDAKRQKEIATLLGDFEPRECAMLSKQCWRRVESLTKQGSSEWLAARLGVITTAVQLNETTEARKLLSLTRLLYPELGGADLKARFEAVEQNLSAGKP